MQTLRVFAIKAMSGGTGRMTVAGIQTSAAQLDYLYLIAVQSGSTCGH